jgi:hypothetical protein
VGGTLLRFFAPFFDLVAHPVGSSSLISPLFAKPYVLSHEVQVHSCAHIHLDEQVTPETGLHTFRVFWLRPLRLLPVSLPWRACFG